MLEWLKRFWPAVILAVLMAAILDGTLSSLLSCHPVSPNPSGGAYGKPTQEECTALHGPILISIVWLLKALHTYEGAVTGIFTVVLAVFTGRLWFSTEKLWQATNTLARDAKATAESQAADTRILQRAYISVEPGGIHPTNDPHKCVAHVIINNAGNLPARDVKWSIDRKSSQDDRLNDFPLIEADAEGKNILPPGGQMRQGSGPLLVNTHIKIEADMFIYIWGAVYYKDGFGKDRITSFCHRYNCANISYSPTQAAPALLGGGNISIDAEYGRYHRYGNDAT